MKTHKDSSEKEVKVCSLCGKRFHDEKKYKKAVVERENEKQYYITQNFKLSPNLKASTII